MTQPAREPLFDIVLTLSDESCPRFVPGIGRQVYVATGPERDWLRRAVPQRSRVVHREGRLAVSRSKASQEDLLAWLRSSGLRYSAFGEENPYPETEAALIRRWEDAASAHDGPSFGAPDQVRRDGRFLWIEVPPMDYGHRECPSHGVIAFGDDADAIAFADYLALPRAHRLSGRGILGYVFDPDLGLGDFGITASNAAAIPGRIGVAAARFRPGRFHMGNNGIVPTAFRSGMLSDADADSQDR